MQRPERSALDLSKKVGALAELLGIFVQYHDTPRDKELITLVMREFTDMSDELIKRAKSLTTLADNEQG